MLTSLTLTSLTFDVTPADQLRAEEKQELIQFCTMAYDENFDGLFEGLPVSVHVRARLAGTLVSHAAWATRWLQPEGLPLLRTAYVEAVATALPYRSQTFGTAVMQQVAANLGEFDLAALSPAVKAITLYQRLGWELWQGPLSIRTESGLLATPQECVMILRLACTPAPLDITRALSAEWRLGELW